LGGRGEHSVRAISSPAAIFRSWYSRLHLGCLFIYLSPLRVVVRIHQDCESGRLERQGSIGAATIGRLSAAKNARVSVRWRDQLAHRILCEDMWPFPVPCIIAWVDTRPLPQSALLTPFWKPPPPSLDCALRLVPAAGE